LVARGFGMQGWPVELLVHPSKWIRAEPGSPGAHIMADILALVPTETNSKEGTNNPDGAPSEDQSMAGSFFDQPPFPRQWPAQNPIHGSWLMRTP